MTKPTAASRKPQARRLRRWMMCAAVLLAIGYWLSATSAFAQLNTGIDFGTATGLSTQDIRVTVAKIIRAALGLLGTVALVIVIYGGFLYMTAGGDTDRIDNAKKWLTNGAIGLTIILLSVSITQFVISRLNAALYGSGSVSTTGRFDDGVFLSGALGAGPIESHFPTRGQQDVARNTRIFITFREPIYPASIAADMNGNGTVGTTGEDVRQFDNYQDLALPEAIQVAPVGTNVDPMKLTATAKASDAAAFTAEAAKLVPVGFAVSADGRTIVLSPVVVGADGKVVTANGYARRALLGNAQSSTAYLVRITSAVKKATKRTDGTQEDLFSGAFREGYAWDFTVSTTVDLTPPKITSVIPFPDAGRDTADGVVGKPDQPRNVIVQVNFNEAMDPTVTTGTFTRDASDAANFSHLAVEQRRTFLPDTEPQPTLPERVQGEFTILNQYRTVEFTTDDECGQNSCGGTVYCLPKDAEIRAWVDAARLEQPGEPTGLPFSGVMDAAGNSLDGSGDGRVTGPGSPRYDLGKTAAQNATASDSAEWAFFTTGTLDLTAPVIEDVFHYSKQDQPIRLGAEGVSNISLTKPIEVLFSKLMSGNVTGGMRVSDAGGCNLQSGSGCLWHSASAAHTPADAPVKTRVTVDHAAFRDAQPGFDPAPPQYGMRVDSGVKDVYQNCFFTVDAPTGPRGPAGGRSCTTQNCS